MEGLCVLHLETEMLEALVSLEFLEVNTSTRIFNIFVFVAFRFFLTQMNALDFRSTENI